MYFVPEGQYDSSQARSAWESVPPKNPSRRGAPNSPKLHAIRVGFQSLDHRPLLTSTPPLFRGQDTGDLV
jgi:hypothetical protein